MGVVFAYRVVANKPSITEIHKEKKKGMRDRSRGRSPGGWVAQTPEEVSSFSPLSPFYLLPDFLFLSFFAVSVFLHFCCFVDISLLFFSSSSSPYQSE